MDFVNIIGKNFENISFNKNEYSIEFEDEEWEEGIEPKWTVNAKDGSFSMSLNKDKSIETVWLYPVNGQFRFENYSNETTRELVRSQVRYTNFTRRSRGIHFARNTNFVG